MPTFEVEVILAPYFQQIDAPSASAAARRVELQLLNQGFEVSDTMVVELDDYEEQESDDD